MIHPKQERIRAIKLMPRLAIRTNQFARRGLAIAVAFLLSACGGGSDGGTTGPTNGNPNPPAAVASVSITPSSANLTPAQTTQLTAATRDAAGNSLTGRTVSWSSGSNAIATVANGVVTGVGPGTTAITATSEGKSASAQITVTAVAVDRVVLSKSEVTLLVGGRDTITATAQSSTGAVLDRVVTWSSANSSVATVAGGVISAVSAGTATITATSEGKSATANIVVNAPSVIASGRRSIVPGYEQTCAVASTGDSYCWGNERYGALGNGVEINQSQLTAVMVLGGHTFSSLTGGYSHSCGLTAAGAAWCWGKAQIGQLGNGTTVNASTPVAVSGNHVFVQLSSGSSDRTCGITDTGEAWCWGSNSGGGLGVGATGAGSSIPVRVAGNSVYRQVAAGASGGCALREDGAPFCWGSNGYGQLGNGKTGGTSSVPVEVDGDHRFVQLVAGFGHYCGRKPDNSVWCWGFNSLGQLGDGTRINRSSPVLATFGKQFVTITAGSVSMCGLSSTGVASCWGDGSSGTLGDGSTVTSLDHFSLTPVPVLGGLQFREISGTSNTLCGIALDNKAYCWGSGNYGIIGDGFHIHRGEPTAVVGMP